MRAKIGITCGIFAMMLLGFSPAIAMAQSAVRGHGKAQVQSGDEFLTSQISVDAWLDDDGAHGTVVWVGGVPFTPGHPQKAGPADPWLIDVTNILFDGNTAHVFGVVVHSVFPADIGTEVPFLFTDNSGTGEPDEIGVFGSDPVPIVAGNIVVE